MRSDKPGAAGKDEAQRVPPRREALGVERLKESDRRGRGVPLVRHELPNLFALEFVI